MSISKKSTFLKFSEILADHDTLGSDPPKSSTVKGYLCITMNYPRTNLFLKMNSLQQKVLYKKLWRDCQNVFGEPDKNEFYYEFCKSGQVHLHGVISLSKTGAIEGFISDYVKRYLNLMPKKHSKFKPACLYSQYSRYRSPSICVQYVEDCTDWLKYCHKDIDKDYSL